MTKQFKSGSEIVYIKAFDCDGILEEIRKAKKHKAVLLEDTGYGDKIKSDKSFHDELIMIQKDKKSEWCIINKLYSGQIGYHDIKDENEV